MTKSKQENECEFIVDVVLIVYLYVHKYFERFLLTSIVKKELN